MTLIVYPHVTVTVDTGPALKPTGGTVSLQSLRVPYATAVIVLPLTADTLLDSLDPRDLRRVIINASNTGHWEETP
jgi:hypothetical protein